MFNFPWFGKTVATSSAWIPSLSQVTCVSYDVRKAYLAARLVTYRAGARGSPLHCHVAVLSVNKIIKHGGDGGKA
jgi:hypothetical protein